MIELVVILFSAMPFIVGVFALHRMRKRKDTGTDDMPPPPDPQPPMPLLPSTPETRRTRRHRPIAADRGTVRHAAVGAPRWEHRVRY